MNICSIKDTNWLDYHVAQELMKGVKDEKIAKKQIELLQDTFKDAKEYGSIIDVKGFDFEFWDERIKYFKNLTQATLYTPVIRGRLRFSIKQAKIMQERYECVISNPPYAIKANLGTKLYEYIQNNYKNYSNDLFTVFIKKMDKFIKLNSYFAMITPHSWMTLGDLIEIREHILRNHTISSMVHMGVGAFGADFGSTSFVIKNRKINNYISKFKDLSVYKTVEDKHNNYYKADEYIVNQDLFLKLPNKAIAYTISNSLMKNFDKELLSKYAITREGMTTGNNDTFLRYWFEINNLKSNIKEDITSKWYKYNKGGDYRKWYGNNNYVVNWENDGYEILNFKDETSGRIRSHNYNGEYIKKNGISWGAFSSIGASFRRSYKNTLFDSKGSMAFPNDDNLLNYILGFLNSKVAKQYFKVLSGTRDTKPGHVSMLPLIISNDDVGTITDIVENNIKITKNDWDDFETSWDFKVHPLLKFANIYKGLVDGKTSKTLPTITDGDRIEDCFNEWKSYKQVQYEKLKNNEEELNKLFIKIYNLQLNSQVEDKISVELADEKREIKSLLSYAVGCMFGRYSLDEEGLIFAGGEFDKSRYEIFPADDDAVIPVLSEHLFSDDITSRFKEFLKVAFGEKYFDENLEYVANVLGKKNTETADDTIRNYFMKDFYNDHIKMYQKRPIYWMFSSPKGNFKALVYMHRYNKDTASVILNTYLRNYRDEKLKAKIENCKQIELSGSSSQSDKIKAQKQREEMEKIVKEVSDWEHDVLYPLATERKEIDLDDGVKVNYLKFGKALKDFGLKAK